MFGKLFYYALRFVGLIFTLGLFWAVGLAFFIRAIPLTPPHPFPHAQGIVVFTGTPERVQRGLELHEELGLPLLISGVNEVVQVGDLSDEPLGKHPVTLGREALDTEGNAKETEAWIKDKKITSIILVTSNYHMPRSRLELKGTAPDLEVISYPTVNSRFRKKDWWRDSSMLSLVMAEYNKYIFALMRYTYTRFNQKRS